MGIPPFHWWRTVFFLIPAISLYTIVLGTLSIGSSLFEKRGYFAHWCARTWSRLILRTTGVQVEVHGLERLAADGTYVFVANHQSIYDIPILFWSLPFQLRIIAKESLGRFPFLGWHLRRTGHMLVDRARPDRTAIFAWASALVSKGLSLIVFPEGTRTKDGRIGKIQPGIAMIVRRAGVPVIPAVIEGSYQSWPKGRKVFRAHPIRVMYGPALKVEGMKGERIVEVIQGTLEEMQERVKSKM